MLTVYRCGAFFFSFFFFFFLVFSGLFGSGVRLAPPLVALITATNNLFPAEGKHSVTIFVRAAVAPGATPQVRCPCRPPHGRGPARRPPREGARRGARSARLGCKHSRASCVAPTPPRCGVLPHPALFCWWFCLPPLPPRAARSPPAPRRRVRRPPARARCRASAAPAGVRADQGGGVGVGAVVGPRDGRLRAALPAAAGALRRWLHAGGGGAPPPPPPPQN